MTRRVVDVAVAVLALSVLSPILAVLALSVLVSSGRPVLYAGIRVGRDETPFRMWKFRTMVRDAERSGSVSGPNDPRITRIGRVLRATKLDELPQFVNLLRGDITLVGPRPEVPATIARYDDHQRCVLAYTPGITAPGELFFTEIQEPSIPAGVDAEAFFFEHLLAEKVAIDLEYFARRTAKSDVTVVLHTVRTMIRGALARHRGGGTA